jgi:hypothetical protein
MSSTNLDKGALPVVCSTGDGEKARVAMSGSTGTFSLADFEGKIVTLESTVDVFIFIGPASDVTAPTSGDDDDTRGRKLSAGVERDFYIPKGRSTLRHSDATGSIHVYRSSR